MTTDRQFSLGFPPTPPPRGKRGLLWFLMATVIICWQLFISVSKFIAFSWKCFFLQLRPVKLCEGWKHVRSPATARHRTHDVTSLMGLRGGSSKNPPCASTRTLFMGHSHKFQLHFTRATCLTFGFHATQCNQTKPEPWKPTSNRQWHFRSF